MKKVYRQVIMLAVTVVFLTAIIGCGTEDNKGTDGSFPESCIAEDYPLPDDFLGIFAAAAKDSICYFSVLKDISGNQSYNPETAVLTMELCYIDLSKEESGFLTVPYTVKDKYRITQIAANKDSTLELVVQYYSEIKETGEPEITETMIKRINVGGEELLSYPVGDDIEHPENLAEFTTDKDGNAYIIIRDTLYVWNEAGQLLCTIQIPGSFGQISQSREGAVYLVWSGIDGYFLARVDAKNGRLESKKVLESEQVYVDMAAGIHSSLLLADSKGIYEYDTEQGEGKKIISLSQLDVPAGLGGQILPLSGEKVAWMQQEGDRNTLTVIRGAEESEIKGKKSLILGGTIFSVHPWHYQAAAKFNKTSPDVRVEIKTYGTDEADDGINELNMDIANGKGPDIMILPRQFSMDLYTQKEVLIDLYPYIDNDGELERSDFQENILRAYETDGKLYGMPVNYWITTIIASKSATGEINHWNLDEMITFTERYMPESTVFSAANKSHVLEVCLMANGDSLIDLTEEGQGFNRELFEKMLLFADRFVPDERYTYDENLIRGIQDAEQIQLLCHKSILGFADQQVYKAGFGEPVSYPGFPSEKGNGNLIDSNFVMAVNNACEDKAAAWQFIKSLLSEEYQSSLVSAVGFPIRKKVMEQKMK